MLYIIILHLSSCFGITTDRSHREGRGALYEAVGGMERLDNCAHNSMALDADAQRLLGGQVCEHCGSASNSPVSLGTESTDQGLNGVGFSHSTRKVDKSQTSVDLNSRKEEEFGFTSCSPP